MQVSHETIYLSLYVQSRGVLKRELLAHLRRGRRFRHSRHATTAGQRRGQIIDAVSIRERPPIVEDRAVPGHWEGDLLTGRRNSHVATLVERQSRYLMLIRVRGKDTRSVVHALTRRVTRLPQGMLMRIAGNFRPDRDPDLAAHRTPFTVATNVQVYSLAIRRVRGNGARTKTPTGSCASIRPAPIVRLHAIPLDAVRGNSTRDLGKRLATKRPRLN